MRLATAIACILAIAALAAPARAQAPNLPLNPRKYGADRVVVVHYARLDGQYDGWNLWAWPVGKEGAPVRFDGTDAFGRFAVIPLPRNEKVERVGFIVRKGEWESKDHDGDRFIDVGPRPVTEAWIVSGDATVHAKAPAIDRTPKLVAAFLDARDRVTVASSVPIDAALEKSIAIVPASGIGSFAVRDAKPVKGAGGTRPVSIPRRSTCRRWSSARRRSAW